MDADVDQLIATWTGRQGSRFEQGWAEVRQAVAEMLDAIADTTVALDDNAEASASKWNLSPARRTNGTNEPQNASSGT
nr:WXG100 family type VII secretion target [Nocardia donostiensis]